MITEWKVGDRVMVKGEAHDPFVSERGTVGVDISPIGVVFDAYNEKFHSLGGECPDGHGWWVDNEQLTRLEEHEVDTNNPLYNFRAHEELGEDAWGGLSKAVHDVVWDKEVGEEARYTWEYVGPYFKAWESEYKSSTGLPIPGAWRSAKSVIKNAMSNGVAMWNEGEPRGKTAVENDIKAAREREKDEKDPQDVLDKLVLKAMRYYNQHGASVTSWADAVNRADDVIANGDK